MPLFAVAFGAGMIPPDERSVCVGWEVGVAVGGVLIGSEGFEAVGGVSICVGGGLFSSGIELDSSISSGHFSSR